METAPASELLRDSAVALDSAKVDSSVQPGVCALWFVEETNGEANYNIFLLSHTNSRASFSRGDGGMGEPCEVPSRTNRCRALVFVRAAQAELGRWE